MEHVQPPSAVIAQIILSLINTGRVYDAKVLMSKLDVDCHYFIGPVKRLKDVSFLDICFITKNIFSERTCRCKCSPYS